MISINKLPQAKKRLEEDLQKIYNSAYKSYNDFLTTIWPLDEFPEEALLFRDKTEDEIIEYLIREANPDLSEDERRKIKIEREAIVKEDPQWKSHIRSFSIISRQLRYNSVLPKIAATGATLFYDVLVHSILFSNWRWKNEKIELADLDLQLSPKEVCDRLFDFNPDVVSVLINKMEGCSIADREIFQSAFETGKKEAFIESLKGLSISDYNSLVLFVSCIHVEDAFISVDLERLDILLNHIDFENQLKLNLRPPLKKSWEMMFPDQGFSDIDSYCDVHESFLDSFRDNFTGYPKVLANALEQIKPNPFPFERKYLDDLFNDSEVKVFFDELPECSDEVIGALEDQKQPEPQPIVEPEEQKPGGERKPEEPKPYRFEWPSWEEFKEKKSIGIPKGFEFLTKLVDGIDINTKDGYENLKEFLDVVADYGSIDDDANMMALIQFITGKCFDGASSKIRWEADNKMGRVLFFVVQWISDDDGKLGKTARMTDFKFSDPGNPDTGIDMDRISSTLQRAKGIDDDILDRLHACYAFIPGTKDDAQKRKS